ncbi:phosphohydrolase (plasmid) [Clostridioides difficile]|uniref:phosphohydrolase n=1 Tax=Clostridioides difficile TaxID=1496 RepID=UPI000BB1E91F|nr:phosphohydrolase [Clostridioides difficile]EGT3641062.1 phosphohydrolase [Clostridioides difficile]MBH7166033.1 phosphohydrolase [Clostridioides difficile]MBH7845747.1 phosphohydrolase [Clostridioides difficile]MBY1661645.1 phosphohydrolase [Clostridioides difficile]PBG00072.1 phosphohydrolase [Clostridioides difficile]
MKIEELKFNSGVQKILCNVDVVENITKKKDKYYLKMDFSDSTGKVSIMIWDNDPNYEYYKGLNYALAEASLEFVKVNSGGYEEYALHDLVVKERPSITDCVDKERLKDELRNIIRGVKDESLRNICFGVCKEKEILNGLFEAPGSEQSAYSFSGGILAHIVRLCKLSIAIGNVFNSWTFNKEGFNEKVNVDLLITISILHDLGNVEAFEIKEGIVKKTIKGKIFENSYLTSKILNNILDKYGSGLDESHRLLLEHAVTSSKGKQSYGAINTPRTKEANLFHNIEKIDILMGNFEFMDRCSLDGDFEKLFDKLYCLWDFE